MMSVASQVDVPLVTEFEQQLCGLVRNDAKIIHGLTALAARAKGDADAHMIAACVARLIITSDTDKKMPVFYLMDSLMKNAPPVYTAAFACFVAELFSAVFTLVSSSEVRNQMWRLYDIWATRGAFEPLVLESMQLKLSRSGGRASGTCWLEVPDLLKRMCQKLPFVRLSHVTQCPSGEQDVLDLLRLLARLNDTLNKSDEDLLSIIKEYEQNKERPLKALKALYNDMPHRCNRCAMRYKTREALADHLDAHYFETMAGRTKHGVRVQRNWFVSASNWITTNGGLASAPNQRSAPAAGSSKEPDTGNSASTDAYFLTIDASNEWLGTKCGACGDDIDGAVYREDGSWAYPNTVQSGGDDAALYHVECAKWLVVPNKKRRRAEEKEQRHDG